MFLNKRVSSFLDFLRWFSAFLVVVYHLRAILFVDYHTSASTGIFWSAFYFITGFGHLAVMIFFVLSGLLVGGDVVKKIREKKFNFKIYFIHRFSRIYAVLPLALILGCILDYSGRSIFTQIDFSAERYGFPQDIVRNILLHLNLPTFFSNLFMLQDIYFPSLGSNLPLWSLSNEFWYYVLFPLALISFKVKNKYIKAAILLVLCFVLCMAYKIIPGFMVWLLGVFLLILKRPIFKNSFIPWSIFLLVLGGIRMGFLYRVLNGAIVDFLFGITVVLVLNNVGYLKDKESAFAGFNKSMASFSYSLYLLHLPFIFFCSVVLKKYFNVGMFMQPSYRGFLIYVSLLTMVYVYSYFVAYITERNTSKIRDFLIAWAKRVHVVKA